MDKLGSKYNGLASAYQKHSETISNLTDKGKDVINNSKASYQNIRDNHGISEVKNMVQNTISTSSLPTISSIPSMPSVPEIQNGLKGNYIDKTKEMGSTLLNSGKTQVINLANNNISGFEDLDFDNDENLQTNLGPLIDAFFDQVLLKAIKHKIPERERFTDKAKEIEAELSIIGLIKDIHIISEKLPAVYEFQDALIRIVTWRNPTGTLVCLILGTLMLMNPINIGIIISIFSIYCVMIPGFICKHPYRQDVMSITRRNVTKKCNTRNYGSSFFFDMATSGPSNAWYPISEIKEYDKDSSNLEVKEVDPNNNNIERSGIAFITTVKDIKNLIDHLIQINRMAEQFVFDIGGFKDEYKSSLIFIIWTLLVIIMIWISKFINWNIIIIGNLWIGMLLIHPIFREKLMKLFKTTETEEERLKKEEKLKEEKEKQKYVKKVNMKKMPMRVNDKVMIFDEKPEIAKIEIFEIYKRNELNFNKWEFFLYSTQVFDKNDSFRKSQTPPPGVQRLIDVTSPKPWVFDQNFDWEIDNDVRNWVMERDLVYSKENKMEDEYLVDNEFKRRRLVRTIIRYSAPLWNKNNF
ncbi:hypothetical protein TBLA_0B07420 [Henningerozyma blattae CBS 6284]|uniref:TECPR1-like DysF domain-containing protein n=1 Tax=Henningerozyma blattae (strain ATCC 34711 / CBS 6284 / DSM 70876 / NBRC 10599 / NRRL Y-10934 / UCD 77-7) TaxID=1071380 RepID=I2GZK8_HENB6|nr:hypothetical protein TBLA_0B07420 [Tetrapisispora blattae CBS 6284]CCH59560.1 hypothetical protein TBLA_0B07420 [Tetrapisispora blattae CBS 6284]